MTYEFVTPDTPLPACRPFPKALEKLPLGSTEKVAYCHLLDAMLTAGTVDGNGILYVEFPVAEIAARISRCGMTAGRTLKGLERAGLVIRRRQGHGRPNRIYVLLPKDG